MKGFLLAPPLIVQSPSKYSKIAPKSALWELKVNDNLRGEKIR
jgi:hypothetical protein